MLYISEKKLKKDIENKLIIWQSVRKYTHRIDSWHHQNRFCLIRQLEKIRFLKKMSETEREDPFFKWKKKQTHQMDAQLNDLWMLMTHEWVFIKWDVHGRWIMYSRLCRDILLGNCTAIFNGE
jgi:hypothetical protein